MNNVLDLNNEKCSSCQICSAVCPVKAISFSFDEDGFYRPNIDDKCISCGKCKQNCVKFVQDWKIVEKDFEVYSAINKDKKILADSSSGGIATALYEYALDNGYKCFGVYYDDEVHKAKAFVIKEKKDIEKARHSKYIPVYAENVLHEVVFSTDKWLIIAQPCMLYGIKKSLQNNRINLENYIFIDFFCHGVPSQLLWNKQIQEISKKYGEIKEVNFRSKNACWHAYLLSFISFGKQIYKKNVPFYDLFFSDYMLNSACSDCTVRNLTNIPDIRIGDFWGKKFDLSLEGVSAVVCFSEKGKELVHKINNCFVINKEDPSSLLPFQAVNKTYKVNQKVRKKMFISLKKNNGLKKALRIYLKSLPIKKKIEVVGKKIIKRIIPAYFQAKIRKIFHIKNQEQ